MQGGPAKNYQLPEPPTGADGGRQNTVQVLKTTKFVNISSLEEYLSSVSDPNCRVVVQRVEQGSDIARKLERALEMQQQKAAAASAGLAEGPGAPVQHAVPTPSAAQGTAQTATMGAPAEDVRRMGQNAAVVRCQEYYATEVCSAEKPATGEWARRSSAAYEESHGHPDDHVSKYELTETVSSLLMQLKQIQIGPNKHTTNDRGRDTTIDTYTSFADYNGKRGAGVPSVNMIVEEPKTPVETSANTLAGACHPSTEAQQRAPASTVDGSHRTRESPMLQSLKPEDRYYSLELGSRPVEPNQPPSMQAGGSQSAEHVASREAASIFETAVAPHQTNVWNNVAESNDAKLVKRFTPTVRDDTRSADASTQQRPVYEKTPQIGPVDKSGSVLEHSTAFNTAATTPRMAPVRRMGPRRRAVVVGCNYSGNNEAALRGPSNDAMLFASALVTNLGFDADEVLLLVDTEPDDVYSHQLVALSRAPNPMGSARRNSGGRRKTGVIGGVLGGLIGDVFKGAVADEDLDLPEALALCSSGMPVPEEKRPTRSNILKALRWLVSGTRPGDCGVFYFSGHAVQTDDMSGWEGEGYDEALVPCDYVCFSDPADGVIPARQVRQLIQSANKGCQMTIVMDTVGMQTSLDPASGLGPWRYIKGAVLRGIWPLADATGKLHKAEYDPQVWSDLAMHNQMVRPKFLPTFQVNCAAALMDGFMSPITGNTSSNCICIAAAPFQDVAVEAMFRPLSLVGAPIAAIAADGCEQVICHGVFTYCLVATLLRDRASKRGGITVRELVAGVQRRCKYLRGTRLPRLQQQCEATVHPAGLASLDDFFLSPWGGRLLSERSRRSNGEHPYGALAAGVDAFLTLPQAWMQMHNEGRMRAVEQQEKFGRMRSAVVNGSRMVTADLRQMLLQQQQDQAFASRAPSAAVMLGHVPPQQRAAAGYSWAGKPQCAQMNMHCGPQEVFISHPAFFQPPQHHPQAHLSQGHHPVHPFNHYQPVGQEYMVEPGAGLPHGGFMYPAQQFVDRRGSAAYYEAQPPHFGADQMQQEQAFLQYVPQQVAPQRQASRPVYQCRSNTSAMLERGARPRPAVARNNTGACRRPGVKLAGPLTSTLVSQLPTSQHYY